MSEERQFNHENPQGFPTVVPVGISNLSMGSTPKKTRRRPSVLVCRGCCCGNPGRHPWIDHDEHLRRLRAACAGGGVKVRTVGCLGECQASNLVVVKPPVGDPLWIGQINDDARLNALCGWLATGAEVTPAVTAVFADHILKRHPAVTP